MGRIPLVRLELELRGFKASILLLIIVLHASWDFIDQIYVAIMGYREKKWGMNENKRSYNGDLTKLEVSMKMWKWFVKVHVAAGKIEQQRNGVASCRPRNEIKHLVSCLGMKEEGHQGACLQEWLSKWVKMQKMGVAGSLGLD
ncbi:hypothetical protein Tco_0862758 [Tanacetum coccineum]